MKQEDFGWAEFNALSWQLASLVGLLRKCPSISVQPEPLSQALHPTASFHSSFWGMKGALSHSFSSHFAGWQAGLPCFSLGFLDTTSYMGSV